MKTIIYSFILALSSSVLTAQNVNIPDAAFKSILLSNPQINLNNDSQIQISEAEAFTGTIDFSSRAVQSVEGIQAFKNLTGLNGVFNQLTSIDISQNINLKTINVIGNQLTALDVSKNTMLTSLQCDNNKLTVIDVSKNFLLTDLWVGNNFLTNLDISKNILLKSLYAYNNAFSSLDTGNNINLGFLLCNKNQITSLDLSKNNKLFSFWGYDNKLTFLNLKNGANSLITSINIVGNPNLTCVKVDDANYSEINWVNKDATASYSTNCLLGTSEISKSQISVYPNPAKNILYFSEKSNMEIYNSAGQKLKSEKQISSSDISKLSRGIYFVILTDNSGKEIQKTKIIKE